MVGQPCPVHGRAIRVVGKIMNCGMGCRSSEGRGPDPGCADLTAYAIQLNGHLDEKGGDANRPGSISTDSEPSNNATPAAEKLNGSGRATKQGAPTGGNSAEASNGRKGDQPQNNGGGKQRQPDPAEQVVIWINRMRIAAGGILRADPEYHKAHLTEDTIVEPLVRELWLDVTEKPEYAAPPTLQDAEIQLELVSIAKAMWQRFKEKDRNELILANDAVPAIRADTASVYEIENQPALTALRVYEADEFFAETADLENIEWLWDRIAPSCGLIGIFGDPEAGKSTFCRTLALSLGSGLGFMGRGCMEAKVLYLDLAEERLSHRRAFQRLGWSKGNVKIVSQPSLIGMANGMDLVENAIRETGARCFIVDMMADLLRFKDLNDYADAKRALRGARLLSQRTKSLGVLLHHTPKALGPDADVLKAGLGSQAIVGAFDLRMAVRRREKDLSTLVMSNGKLGGDPLTEEFVLVRHPETDWIEMGPKWGRARAEYYVDRCVAFLQEAQGEKMAASTVAQALNLAPGWIRGSLYRAFKDGRLDRAKAGRGYVYGALAEVKPPEPEKRDEDDAFKWEK